MDEINVGEWISVEDRLPEASDTWVDDNYEVLCYRANGRIFVGCLVNKYKDKYEWRMQTFGGGTQYAGKVTHWMPLPHRPKE